MSAARVLHRFATWVGVVAVVAVLVGAGRAEERPQAAAEPVKEAPTIVLPSTRPHRVIAYYFHTTQRCASCRAIEAYAREAIETAFARELEDGRLVWRRVNIEVRGNEHFAKDYALYTKSLILVNEVRGQKPQWKNLEKVWQYLHDKDRFFRYVQEETRAYLATPRS